MTNTLRGLSLSFLILLISCSEEEVSAEDSFFKIYDDSNADLSYNPIDFVQTTDGFILLTGTELNNSDYMGIKLVKIDSEGEFELDVDLTGYVVPIGDVQLIDSVAYFFGMNPLTLDVALLGVNTDLQLVVESVFTGLEYPLASSVTSNNELILLSYDPLNLNTELSLINPNGTYINGVSMSIGPGSDVESEIINHYLQTTEQPLPFFCGEISNGSYYFNGFYNYSFSMVFTDLSSVNGVMQGQFVNAGVRYATPLANGNFALSGYQFDENFLLPSVSINTNEIASSVDLYAGDVSELKAYTPAKIISYDIQGETYTIFASETKGNEIILYFFDSEGNIDGIHQLGFLTPYGFSSLKVTDNNSLTVLGTNFVAGRFKRIALTKLSEDNIRGFLN